jgi:phosphohistidine phosphatase
VKTLHLLRHAESGPAGPGIDDHDRPLAALGEAAATAIGAYFARQSFRPSVVLCSSALRTRQTLEQLRPHLPDDPEVLVEKGLYLASCGELLARLQEIDDGSSQILLIGHNPGIADLARSLVARGEASALRRMAARFPAAAAASCEFDLARWRELAPGSGSLLAFATPADLP